ncbi:hypothetical protein SB57_09830 [Lactobacillus delbrueckii subsp. bulgaricus]|nr:hypothetical protein SB57_09830 [Lactobacillus delbrueckii subsp. bulgaricus]
MLSLQEKVKAPGKKSLKFFFQASLEKAENCRIIELIARTGLLERSHRLLNFPKTQLLIESLVSERIVPGVNYALLKGDQVFASTLGFAMHLSG